jgi:hypothetical protein
MKKNKPQKTATPKTLTEILKTLNQIQRDELEMEEHTNSYSHLNSLYQHFTLLQSQMTSEVGPHRARVALRGIVSRQQAGFKP